MQTQLPLSGKANTSAVTVHPLVLLSVVDHYNRVIGAPVAPPRTLHGTNVPAVRTKRVVGVLLGQFLSSGRVANVSNSFALPFEEDIVNENVWFLDQQYLESMFELFKKVSARERIIGWYSTGPKLKACDMHIHNQIFRKYTPNPVLVLIDVAPRDNLNIPTDSYQAIEEIHENSPSSYTFAHLSSQIEGEEAEEIGVEHLLRDIVDHALSSGPATYSTQPLAISEKKGTNETESSGSTDSKKLSLSKSNLNNNDMMNYNVPLSTSLTNGIVSLRSLSTNLSSIVTYLEKISKGEMPLNQPILALLQSMFNSLPVNVQDPLWNKANLIRGNDEYGMLYVSSLLRSILALHGLVDNKLKNREAEEKLTQLYSGNVTSNSNNGTQNTVPIITSGN